jgi:mevalonate kinase
MDKNEVLTQLRTAKAAHIKWLQKAKLLITGIEVDENAIPIDSTECNFGKWFYSEGQMLNALSNNPIESMKEIETLHSKLHDKYLKIFSIFFAKDKKTGFFAQLFGKKRKDPSTAEQELAKEYYSEMEKISQDLLDAINKLERRLVAVSDEKIKTLV